MHRNQAHLGHRVIVRRILALMPIAATMVFLPAAWTLAGTDTVIIPAAKDNTLFSDPTGSLSSGSGAHLFAGSNSGTSARRGVIAFDIAAHVPAGTVIDSVALVLNVSNAPNETPQEVAVHRVLAAWGEGESVSSGGSGVPSAPGDATWIHAFYPDRFWSNPGGDFSVASSAVQTVGTSGPHTWSSPTMVADVQFWLDSPSVNFGWLLRGDEATASSVRRFDSREIETQENRPYLFVAYTS
ncbi:MAG: DNRLRE domain-containing protein, partial [Candidatus Krumholzibacteriia bacterium]